MADPNVTSVVVDGVERWGSADAKWAQKVIAAPEQAVAPAAQEPVQEPAEEAPDAAEDAAPRPGPKPTRSRS